MNKIMAEGFAGELEQFMYERGEYDYPYGERIRWFDGVEENESEQTARNKVTANIEAALLGTASEDIGGADALMEYLNGELNAMDEEDELCAKGNKILEDLDKCLNEPEKE